MGTSFSASFFFLLLAFAAYCDANIKTLNTLLATGDEDQKQVKQPDPGCDGSRGMLIVEEPPEKGPPLKPGKKPKPPGGVPWWKRRPLSPCLPKWKRKKSPPRPAHPGRGWPPVWPPLTPLNALKAKKPLSQAAKKI